MNKLVGHFMTITKHKIAVTKLCFRCGLIKQGILHDLSKYSWVEFSAGVKYYQGNRSPIDAQKEAIGYSLGWLHHKGRNKHHWEYWLDNAQDGIKPIEMPVNYVVEMFCDRVAASRIYQKENYNDSSALNYYLNGINHIVMHEKTKQLILDLLQHVSDHGLDSTILYIRNDILKK
ncbi:MAG: DUF5662 family protein [Erysipelotrichaceae bacterium]